MLVHKSCDLRDVDGRDAVAHTRRGIYFHGSISMSFEDSNPLDLDLEELV